MRPAGALCTLAAAVLAVWPTGATAQAPTLPANDFEALLSLTGGQFVGPSGPVQMLDEAAKPVPPARCGKRSDPLDDPVQGRVSPDAIASPGAEDGWRCNVTLVGQSPVTPGRFRTWRYVDRAGHACAFYDSTLTSPATAPSAAGGPSHGVVVLDMTDPSKPVETMRLTTQAMLSPHESLNLHRGRGLLGAVAGNALTRAGQVEIYDVSQDCRRPVFQGSMPTEFGHESGFSPDGETFWVAGGGGRVLAVDVTNPKLPHTVWSGNMYSHGLSLSANGKTLYQTDPINGNLGILDVSQVEARKPDPEVREISRVTWPSVAIPQNTQALRIRGRPYLLEFDEFAFRFNPATVAHQVGAARLIDLRDPAHPKPVSNLRLAVNSPDLHEQYSDDPGGGMGGPALAYSAHYCAAPRRIDPEIVVCSFMNSGLRVFDVRRPRKPREVAYYVAPPRAGPGARTEDGNIAFSQPAFDPERRQVWYTDAVSGFYALRLARSAWPNPCTRRVRRTSRTRSGKKRVVVRRIRTCR
jgi:hypothetical protein